MKKVLILFCFTMVALVAAAHSNPKNMIVKIETSVGDIKVMLYDETPLHRDNFLKLINQHYYDSTLFHRVIKDFMIQAGDPDSKGAPANKQLGAGGPDYTVPAEIVMPKYYHKKGALAAARQADQVNPQRNSSGSQFYIVQGKICTDQELDAMEHRLTMALKMREPFHFTDQQRLDYKTVGGTPFLDGQYTVFGEVIEGFDVLDKIAETKTGRSDRPVEDIIIISTKVVKH